MVTDNDSQQQPLLEHEDIEHTLLEHSQTHFAKADSSPFTQEPLNRLLKYDGIMPFGDTVYNGSPAITTYNFDEHTLAILQNLWNKLPTKCSTPHILNYKLLTKGIKKWPERTTTSPSGRHLGIYKTLLKHVVKKKKANETELDPETDDDNQGLLKQGRDILYLVFDIMTIALKHMYLLK